MYELGIVPVQCTSYRIFGGKIIDMGYLEQISRDIK